MILLEGTYFEVTLLQSLDTPYRCERAWDGRTVGNVQGQRRAPEGIGICPRAFARDRVDDQLNIPLQHAIHHVWRSFIDFVDRLHGQTGPGDRRCRALRGQEAKAER